ncbi:hypothetical protein pdam_00020671 [Pocillopora damicornis]|uniref:Uncharacterized protein n=1 Tax=Pocillopora damicornis TaxID=46731 RepID=A0A3M6TU91_POCDA|nr:hypothetical protein pdam_00020671 [Pocillopora damicornis]
MADQSKANLSRSQWELKMNMSLNCRKAEETNDGCIHVHPDDLKTIDQILKKLGVIERQNTFGKLPYPYKPQVHIVTCEGGVNGVIMANPQEYAPLSSLYSGQVAYPDSPCQCHRKCIENRMENIPAKSLHQNNLNRGDPYEQGRHKLRQKNRVI